MSILIPGVEMPDSCNHCFVTPGCCPAVRKRIKSDKPGYKWIPANYRHEDCPLIELPPHGDLIDASEKIRVQMYDDEHEDFHTVEMTIDDLLSQSWVKAYAFPVIPASEEGET